MKAHVCTQLGLPNQLQFKEIDDPTPTPNQVLVSVKAAGVNFPDGLIVAGTYQTKPPLPFIPGSEVAGVVHSVGSDVQGVTPGMRVMAFCGMGGYAELVAVTSDKVFVIPDSMSFSDAAGFVVTYGTSYHALVDRAAIRPGETLLVLGASGGVGLTAIEIGKALGARVVAAASSEAKLEVCKQHGADELINYTTGNLRERVAQVAPSGVDVVYDPVGGRSRRYSGARIIHRRKIFDGWLRFGADSEDRHESPPRRWRGATWSSLGRMGEAESGVQRGQHASALRHVRRWRSVSSCEQHPPADQCSYRTRGSHESTSAGQSHPLNQPRMTIHDKRCRQWT